MGFFLINTFVLQHLRGLVMSIFNWGIYGGIGLSFPVGRYISELNIGDLVSLHLKLQYTLL